MTESVTTLSPDTPAHVLSDWTQERCGELGLPCELSDNGLTITVPAKEDGLPDWERFLRVAKELKAAEAWVMEGAEPWKGRVWNNSNFFSNIPNHKPASDEVPEEIYHCLKARKNEANSMAFYYYPWSIKPLADLSRACVAYSRAKETA